MSRPVKSRWLGARIDEGMSAHIQAYVDMAELTVGDLVRVAVTEYIANHPTKQPYELTKPGVLK